MVKRKYRPLNKDKVCILMSYENRNSNLTIKSTSCFFATGETRGAFQNVHLVVIILSNQDQLKNNVNVDIFQR